MASNFVNTHPQFTVLTNGSFAPASDGEIEFFTVGNTGAGNRKDTYNVPNPSTPPDASEKNPNPVPLDDYGRSTVPIFLQGSYNTVIRDAEGNQIDTSDNVSGFGGSGVNSIVVDNVTELAALDTNVYVSAYIRGTTTVDDGGQSWFYYSSGSVAADNGTTIIEPDVGAGRWLILQVATLGIKDLNVTTGKLAANAVTAAKINGNVISAVNKYIHTSNATFTPAANTVRLDFELIGGGGGGGGVIATGVGEGASSGAGGGGAYCYKSTTTIDASYTLVVGAASAGGTAGANDGVAGVDTTCTSSTLTLVAGGGAAGTGGNNTSGASFGVGASGGTATGGDINASGGDAGYRSRNADTIYSLSFSGSSFLGHSQKTTLNATGVAGQYGSGGAGVYKTASQATNRAGGAGGAGLILITEYVKLA